MSQALSTRMALAVMAFASPVASFAATGPTITQILNNSSGTPPGLPNYGIAPSSIFIVTGGDLAGPGVPVLQSSAAPGLPLTLNGASITVVVNGVTTHSRAVLHQSHPARRSSAGSHAGGNGDLDGELRRRHQRPGGAPGGGKRGGN